MSDYKPCPVCGARWEATVELTPAGPHYGKASCSNCGAFLRWVPKPDQDKARRPAKHRRLVKSRGVDYCEICLVKESHLPRGETLEGHHIERYADGGEADRGNALTLCTACHTLVHWRQTYVGHFVGKDGQHHVEPEQDPERAEGFAAVGELEDSDSFR